LSDNEEAGHEGKFGPSRALHLPGLVLVSNEQLEDGQEVFLNYRLSPAARPDWYVPVDKEEEKRRWA
jgi:hypothetical protein